MTLKLVNKLWHVTWVTLLCAPIFQLPGAGTVDFPSNFRLFVVIFVMFWYIEDKCASDSITVTSPGLPRPALPPTRLEDQALARLGQADQISQTWTMRTMPLNFISFCVCGGECDCVGFEVCVFHFSVYKKQVNKQMKQ